MTFDEFRTIIREGERKGDIKTSIPMTDYDLAVQYAIGQIGEERGYPCEITFEEIWQRLPEEFREEQEHESNIQDKESV